jgi:hypothetical protein
MQNFFFNARPKRTNPRQDRPQVANYTSKPVDIPPDFLKTTTAHAEAITVQRIDFSTSPLPEYAPYYATVLDNVLSTAECTQLLRLATESSTTGNWGQAMLNVGVGEVLAPEIRLCERCFFFCSCICTVLNIDEKRIVWDHPDLVERIWRRCALASGVVDELGRIDGKPGVQSQKAADRWEFSRLNERMRFLKYGAGQYFKSLYFFYSIFQKQNILNE